MRRGGGRARRDGVALAGVALLLLVLGVAVGAERGDDDDGPAADDGVYLRGIGSVFTFEGDDRALTWEQACAELDGVAVLNFYASEARHADAESLIECAESKGVKVKVLL